MSTKAALSLTEGHFCPRKILSAVVCLVGLEFAGIAPLPAAEITNALEIQSVNVSGKSLPFRGKESVNLGSFPENLVFIFGQGTNTVQSPLRGALHAGGI
ncbi:MAG: hypothetical protein WDM76_04430 [Limisphaerales bacterium]